MSNTIKFNKTLIATMVATSLLTACGGDDTSVEPAAVTVTPPAVDVVVEAPAPAEGDSVVVEAPQTDVDVVIEAPAEATASVFGSVINGKTRAAVAGLDVAVHIDGAVFETRTSANGSFGFEDLVTDADYVVIISDSSGMYATSYMTGGTESSSEILAASAVYPAVTTTVTVNDVDGANVTGLNLYIAGATYAGVASASSSVTATASSAPFMANIPDVVATENNGEYSFLLPDNGTSYEVKVAGGMGDYIAEDGSMSSTIATVSAGDTAVENFVSMDSTAEYTLTVNVVDENGDAMYVGDSLHLDNGEYGYDATYDNGAFTFTLMGANVGTMPVVVNSQSFDLDFSDFTANSASLTITMTADNEVDETVDFAYNVLSTTLDTSGKFEMVVEFSHPTEMYSDDVAVTTTELAVSADIADLSLLNESTPVWFEWTLNPVEQKYNQGLVWTRYVTDEFGNAPMFGGTQQVANAYMAYTRDGESRDSLKNLVVNRYAVAEHPQYGPAVQWDGGWRAFKITNGSPTYSFKHYYFKDTDTVPALPTYPRQGMGGFLYSSVFNPSNVDLSKVGGFVADDVNENVAVAIRDEEGTITEPVYTWSQDGKVLTISLDASTLNEMQNYDMSFVAYSQESGEYMTVAHSAASVNTAKDIENFDITTDIFLDDLNYEDNAARVLSTEGMSTPVMYQENFVGEGFAPIPLPGATVDGLGFVPATFTPITENSVQIIDSIIDNSLKLVTPVELKGIVTIVSATEKYWDTGLDMEVTHVHSMNDTDRQTSGVLNSSSMPTVYTFNIAKADICGNSNDCSQRNADASMFLNLPKGMKVNAEGDKGAGVEEMFGDVDIVSGSKPATGHYYTYAMTLSTPKNGKYEDAEGAFQTPGENGYYTDVTIEFKGTINGKIVEEVITLPIH